MQDTGEAWTPQRLRALDDAEFQILWFATFGGPPAAMLKRTEMERIFLDSFREGRTAALARRTPQGAKKPSE